MDPLQPGDPRTVGPYTLSGRLGAGGMGQVFFGRSLGGRPVAAKLVLPGHAADPEFRRRFAHEVQAAKRVGGFYTAQVVDADPAADPPWLVTAYIPGPSLHEAVRDHGPLPEQTVRALGAGLAEGLAAVHACGLVHRDLKPGNVLLAADGPRVIDFGIARALDGSVLTAHGAVLGTFAFMSPEQARGEQAGPESDVFSLGSVLAFAATGASPFAAGSVPAVIHRVLSQDPDLASLPTSLRPLVTACLAKDPAARPTVAEVLGQLAGAVHPTGDTGDWLPPTVTAMITKRAVSTATEAPAEPDWGGPHQTGAASSIIPAPKRPAPGSSTSPAAGSADVSGVPLRVPPPAAPSSPRPGSGPSQSMVFKGGKGTTADIAFCSVFLLGAIIFAAIILETDGIFFGQGVPPLGYVLPIIGTLTLLRILTHGVRIRLARCDLRIGFDGIEQGRVADLPLCYRWDEIARVTVRRNGKRGDFWIRILPVPGTLPPSPPPKFHPFPTLEKESGWVQLGWSGFYHARPEEIEVALVRFAGSKWSSSK